MKHTCRCGQCHSQVRRRRFTRFVPFLAYGAAFPSVWADLVIFVRRGARIRFPSGRQRNSRKHAFLSLDAELIFIMRVDALIAEKMGCLLSKYKPETRDGESDVPFPGRLAKCTDVCRCRRSVCSGPFYCNTWPIAHTMMLSLQRHPMSSCIFASSAVVCWQPERLRERPRLPRCLPSCLGGVYWRSAVPFDLLLCFPASCSQVEKAAQRNGQRTGDLLCASIT